MFKKCLSLFICIYVMLSCVTFNAITASAADEVIVSDYFSTSDYTAQSNSSGNGMVYLNENPGTGWSSKWISDPVDSTKIITDAGLYVYNATVGNDYTSNNAPTGRTIRINNYAGKAYRQLSTPINTAKTTGQYTISFKVSDGVSSKENRKDFVFYLGSGMSVGYKWQDPAGGTDYSQVVPYLTIGENEYVSTTAHDANAAYNAPFKDIVVAIELNESGNDKVQVKMIDETDSSVPAWEIERELELTNTIDYIGFGHTTDYAYSSIRVADILISKIDNSQKELAAQAREAMPGYEAVTMIDSITDETLRSELISEYNAYGFAYDRMDNARYVNLYTSGTTSTYGLKWGTENITVDGGAGWSDKWSHSRVQDGKSPNAYITPSTISDTANISDVKDYQILLDAAGTTSSSDTISRKLNTPIDFAVEGEYYVKFTGTWVNYQADSAFRLYMSVGDVLSFGSTYNSTAGTSKLSPMVKVGTGDDNVSESVTVPRRDYYDYILRIVSHADEEDTYELYVCDDGTLSSSTEAACTGSFSSSASVDSISITSNKIRTYIYSVAVDCFNDSITGNPFKPAKVREEIAAADSFEAAQAVADALPTCVAAEYLQATALDNYEYICFDYFIFDQGDSKEITTLDGIYDASSSSNKVRAKYALKNNYKTDKSLNVFFAVYDGEELVSVARSGCNIEAGKRFPEDTTAFRYGRLDTTNVIPSGLTNPVVKVFVWDYNTQEPYCDVQVIRTTPVDPAES